MANKLYKKYKTNLNHENMIEEMIKELTTVKKEIPNLTWNKDFATGGSMYLCFTSKVLLLPETIINGFGHKCDVDKNHFIIQVFRIPLLAECNLENLLRIACYTGILQACMKADDFPEGIVRTFKALNMYSSSVYVDIIELNNITFTKEEEDIITHALVRGNASNN